MKRILPGRRILRGNPFLTERIHDPYHARAKLRESTRCPDCGAQYRQGRWRWPAASGHGLRAVRCPACRRIQARDPAGELVMTGKFLHAHRDEILATVSHIESLERNEHPLNRIMAIDEHDGETVITTTDVHLPHRIAHALKSAWGGEMKTHYDLDGYFTRVLWSRNE